MNCLIVLYSYHHNNTKKVAEAMASVLGALIKSPAETEAWEPAQYDLVGFGAGIDSGRHYREILDFAQGLPNAKGLKCFVFSTSAIQGATKVTNDHDAIRKILMSKGYEIAGEFSCKGYNTNSFLKYIGGMNKNHPNDEDINNAIKFAKGLAGG